MKKAIVVIDAEKANRLLRGERVQIRLTQDVRLVELYMQAPEKADPMAKLFDVFFNGRPA